jgi:hypothetical protein
MGRTNAPTTTNAALPTLSLPMKSQIGACSLAEQPSRPLAGARGR